MHNPNHNALSENVSAQHQSGSLKEWQDNVAILAEGNPVLEHSLAASLASCLLKPFGFTQSPVFHYTGASCVGKSTVLRLGNTIGGAPDQIKPFPCTENAILAGCGSLCVLDEVDFGGGDVLNAIAHAIGKGKTAAETASGTQERKPWLGCVLSAGESPLGDASSLGKKGPEDVFPAVFNIEVTEEMIRNLHGEPSRSSLLARISRETQKHYGTAGRAFIERLEADGGKALEEAKESKALEACCRELLERHPNACPQVKTAARHFALLMVAADLAQKAGVIGFNCGSGVRKVFESYARRLEDGADRAAA